ncbi:protein adenylyltransferase FICD [Octopus bimaculoides]|uniref:protein adenylyltransferase n=1 Tax=Octopus bimaculoides TaxID=37653 RepID=A0A0L8HZ73_OCTBM|nr:protein adenylyltransferase FICD [Octopus bimaculoides]|eukprot:XP_014768120.1 PREDICTED: adenosine monophosphate-protein transferase FICD-like [Octopus bimaculoides]
MGHENNCPMLQSSTKQIFLSKINSDNMPQTLLACVFLAGVVSAVLIVFVSSFFGELSYSLFNIRKEIRKTNNENLHFGTSMIWRGRQKTAMNQEVKKEALTALNLAMDMYAQGKNEKALKLFQHAIALDPLHADILNEYGEFIEKHEKDIVLANHLYSKALILRPTHSKAVINCKRTMPIVEEIDQTCFNRIDKKRDRLYKIPSNHPGIRRAKKETYYLHIYHTNAIEGNTLTLEQTRAIIETRMAIGGKSLHEQNEVIGIDAALGFMNNSLLGKAGNINLDDILEIHKRVLGFVDPTEGGRLRRSQVYVGHFKPPPSKELPELMKEFILWLNSEEVSKIHPIEYAALAHYKLVTIHPFYDGNGRTSRLLMNLILMQAGFPPVSIKVEDRYRYYETLEMANEGDIRPFIRFIAECTERTVDEFLLAAVEHSSNDTLSLATIPEVSDSDQRRIIINNYP